ncbi:hypothetical protein [Comamonas sp. NoAH]|uniref:hypothetical protein n=1 Tax=Comamonas halotolerans TaxID=3041496 RepID=UPI0024E1849D|nr:hypothetical protein [Comamonas sp. NoAH]
MPTPLIPQEIYLLERYTSVEYFAEMRDAWAAMVQAGEDALDAFMRQLPPDYRSRPLWNQPDIVWGERVLPNLRNTLIGLDNGVIHLSHGEWRALQYAGNIEAARAGMWRDHSAEWMPQPFAKIFNVQESIADRNAGNINFTILSGWLLGALSHDYHAPTRGPLNPPASWPVYHLNPHVRVRTDQAVPQNGIYLPDADDCSAQALVKGYDAPEANVGRNPVTTQRLRTEPTTWTLVERIANEGGGTPGQEDLSASAHTRLRREGGQPGNAMGGTPCARP